MYPCPLCGEIVNTLQSTYAVVEDSQGRQYAAHQECAEGLES